MFLNRQGIQALDPNQIIAAQRGDGVMNGLEVTLSSAMTVAVSGGTAVVDGTSYTKTSSTISLDTGEPELPRKDVIYINNEGDIVVAKGAPEAITPEGATRFNTKTPAPSALHNVRFAVLAEVYIAPSQTVLLADDIRNRRLNPIITPEPDTTIIESNLYFSVKDFSAVGDGVADDTTPLQNTINAADTAGGGTVYLPSGNYKITGSVVLKSNISFIGDGWSSIISGNPGANNPFLLMNPGASVTHSNIQIKNLRIDATTYSNSVSVPNGAIMCKTSGNIENLVIENVKINVAGSSSAIHFENASGHVKGVKIQDCDITATSSGIYGIAFRKPTTEVNITNNKVTLTSTTSYNNIALYGSISYFTVIGNTTIGGGHSPIAVSPGSYGNIIGNHVKDVGKYSQEGGIEVEWKDTHFGNDTAHHINIIGNTVEGATWGIFTHRRDTGDIAPYAVIIADNIIENCTVGVNLLAGTDISSYGNKYRNCGTNFNKESGVTMTAFDDDYVA